MVGEAETGAEDGTIPGAGDWTAAAETGASLRSSAETPTAGGDSAPAAAPIPAGLLQELIDAARGGFPNEACGILVAERYAGDDGVPKRFQPMRNAADSPLRYFMDPDEQLRVMLAVDDADEVVWGVFHSHVASAAEPSVTDIGLAQYPESLYLICSLAGTVPSVRAWSIRDGSVIEVPLQVV